MTTYQTFAASSHSVSGPLAAVQNGNGQTLNKFYYGRADPSSHNGFTKALAEPRAPDYIVLIEPYEQAIEYTELMWETLRTLVEYTNTTRFVLPVVWRQGHAGKRDTAFEDTLASGVSRRNATDDELPWDADSVAQATANLQRMADGLSNDASGDRTNRRVIVAPYAHVFFDVLWGHTKLTSASIAPWMTLDRSAPADAAMLDSYVATVVEAIARAESGRARRLARDVEEAGGITRGESRDTAATATAAAAAASASKWHSRIAATTLYDPLSLARPCSAGCSQVSFDGDKQTPKPGSFIHKTGTSTERGIMEYVTKALNRASARVGISPAKQKKKRNQRLSTMKLGVADTVYRSLMEDSQAPQHDVIFGRNEVANGAYFWRKGTAPNQTKHGDSLFEYLSKRNLSMRRGAISFRYQRCQIGKAAAIQDVGTFAVADRVAFAKIQADNAKLPHQPQQLFVPLYLLMARQWSAGMSPCHPSCQAFGKCDTHIRSVFRSIVGSYVAAMVTHGAAGLDGERKGGFDPTGGLIWREHVMWDAGSNLRRWTE